MTSHFEYQNALLMRIKSAGVLPGISITSRPGHLKRIEIWKNERFKFSVREVIVM